MPAKGPAGPQAEVTQPTSSSTTYRRLCVEIHGAVQGVGFRPFVYRLAIELSLAGWIINNSRGVFIEVEGEQPALDVFLNRLFTEAPPRAIIHSLNHEQRLPLGYKRFEIRHSDDQGQKTVLILPDIATCPDCLAELRDTNDRRYGYPFTNCTNCGPRFSIIQALPYDRPNTTMRLFRMCSACQQEYDNPLDRRFHAQPNACPDCGPQLELFLPTHSSADPSEDIISNCVAALRAGQILALKGLGGFHLVVDALNPEAVARLRQRKHRHDKPLAVMAANLAQAELLVHISPVAARLLTSAEAPILLLPRKNGSPVADNVAPGNPNLGVMLPYTPLHHSLLRAFDGPVVATSGNLTDEPICTDNGEALARLGQIADLFLFHNRPIERHVDDSVVWLVENEPRLLRRARGYAPLPVRLPQRVAPVLAVGAHLKNSIALSVEQQVFISQHIGDLETAEALSAFERVIADFLRLYETTPAAIAHDMHPDYLSTRWAKQDSAALLASLPNAAANVPLVAVQHHHAHLAACLAENGRTDPALGVIWDGTGYGPDNTIWGGEFLLGNAAGFERVGKLRPFRLPGGDAAVKAPRRLALALLWELFGESTLERDDLAPIRSFSAAERQLLGQMLRRDVNTPHTTSAGRLFDGVAALIGLHPVVNFEGQAAMTLEYIADPTETTAYPLPVNSATLDWGPLVTAILQDLGQAVSPGVIAAKFHNALIEAILAVASYIGEPVVALSGGCFQNRLLTERAAQRLRQTGFEVLLHRQVPPNDGGVSLGQAAVAAAQLI
jgi:hydrogenase maturation protein HypF